MLQVSGLTKRYGERVLLDDVSFSMRARERLGLVGRNGCGKSTLFRMILGDESPDGGTIVAPRDYRIGHLAQHLEFHEPSVLKEACLGLPEYERDQEYRGEIILAGLGFSEEDMHRPASAFSGGFQIRINLAKLLLSEPNLLLLDEPTNYLDIISMRWLTTFLRGWKGELILISHDRMFMDNVTTDTMLIHRGDIRKMPGGTEKLYSQVMLDEEIYEKTRLNEDKKRKQLEQFITRFRAKASKASLVQSKMKALDRMGEKEQLSVEDTLSFSFSEAPFPGKQMLDVQNISFAYPDGPELIENLSFNVKKGDRIGIIGKNGKGKSTLLRLLAADLKPTAGNIACNQNTAIGYFGQTNIQRLANKLTVAEEIESANPALSRTIVRSICGTMMFEGDDALKKISVLSGGEKSRVLLGKIIAQPTNVLLLDEPTNHLDMESIEALLETVQSYSGAVILVTHSELLLKELATRLIVFQGDVPHVFEHGYDYFLEHEGWGEEHGMSTSSAGATSKPKEKGKKPRGLSEKDINKKMRAIEEKICQLELEQSEVEAQLLAASQAQDIEAAAKHSMLYERLKGQIEKAFQELEGYHTQLSELTTR